MLEKATNSDFRRVLMGGTTGCGSSDHSKVQVVLLCDERWWQGCLGTDDGRLSSQMSSGGVGGDRQISRFQEGLQFAG